MIDYRKTPDDVEWHKERSAIIWEGAGERACRDGRMTVAMADEIAMRELQEKQRQATKTKKQKGFF